ncbi:hypothetical protein GCM10020001_012350 [Nonomuraea salmonea]
MGGDVDDLDLGGREHHRHLLGAGQVGEQLGVAGEDVAGGVQGLLVERSRADRLHLAGHRQRAGQPDVLVRRVPRHRRHLAPREVGGQQAGVDDVDPARLEHRVRHSADRLDPGGHAEDGGGLAQASRVADDDRAAEPGRLGSQQGADDDLRTDAGAVPPW